MSLTITIGPNGSGKSLFAMHFLAEALMKESRLIVTSLSVQIDRLNEYMQKKYGEKAPDVTRRVIRIDKEQMRIFWRYRSIAVSDDYGLVPVARGKFGDNTWAVPDGGVLYILDEIQVAFGAREWQKTGPEFVEYQSQHRKMGDDVMAISPASALIEKQFRILCGECVVLKNMYKMRVGVWKAPRKIIATTYENCPPLPGEEPTTKQNIFIDGEGLANCYRTAEGVGIVGGKADIGKEAKGIPWWYLIPLIGVGGVAVWFICHLLLGAGTNWGFKKMRVGKPEVVGAAVTNAIGVPAASPTPAPVQVPEVIKPVRLPPVTSDKVWLTGITFLGGDRYAVCLSDGRSLVFPDDPEVETIGRGWALVDGVKYRWRVKGGA